jgi:hypothetical protein
MMAIMAATLGAGGWIETSVSDETFAQNDHLSKQTTDRQPIAHEDI